VRRLPRIGRKPALAVAGTSLAAALAVVVAIPTLGGNGGSLRLPPGAPVRVVLAEFSPAQHAFADRVGATLDVAVDVRRVDADTVKPLLSLQPYRIVSTSRSVEHAGDTTLVRYRLVLDCLTRACLPGARGRRDIALAPTVVFYAGPHGKVRHVDAAWPPLRVLGRVSPADIASVSLQLEGEPLAAGPAYKHDPGRLSWLAAAGAALLLLVAAWIVAPLLVPRQPAIVELPAEEAPDRLALALGAVEAVLQPAPMDDRPQALDRLARELEAVGQKQLASQARLLAWRTEEIPPERVADLLEACRRALREKAS